MHALVGTFPWLSLLLVGFAMALFPLTDNKQLPEIQNEKCDRKRND